MFIQRRKFPRRLPRYCSFDPNRSLLNEQQQNVDCVFELNVQIPKYSVHC